MIAHGAQVLVAHALACGFPPPAPSLQIRAARSDAISVEFSCAALMHLVPMRANLRTTNPRKLKHAPRKPLLHHIADPAGHLSRAGIEDAQIVAAVSFGAQGRIAVAQRDAAVGREV